MADEEDPGIDFSLKKKKARLTCRACVVHHAKREAGPTLTTAVSRAGRFLPSVAAPLLAFFPTLS